MIIDEDYFVDQLVQQWGVEEPDPYHKRVVKALRRNVRNTVRELVHGDCMRFQKVFLYCIGSHSDVLDAESIKSMLIKLKISTSTKNALEFFKTLDPSCRGHVTY